MTSIPYLRLYVDRIFTRSSQPKLRAQIHRFEFLLQMFCLQWMLHVIWWHVCCLFYVYGRYCFAFFFSGAVVHDLNMYVWQNNIKILMLSFGQEGSSIKKWGLLFLIALLALTSCWDSLRDAWFLTLQMTPNQKTSALTPLAHEIRSGLRPLPGGSLLQCSIFASSICFQASSLSEKTAWP